MDKKGIRNFFLIKISQLSKRQHRNFEFLITKQLIKFFKFHSHLTGQIGAGYLALEKELRPDLEILMARFDFKIAFPVLIEGQMFFGLPKQDPKGKIWLRPPFEKIEPNWMLIPGVAFNKSGSRLGRGKGYFDRYLDHRRVLKIGICWSKQLVEELPIEQHDCSMDFIITEKFCWDVSRQLRF